MGLSLQAWSNSTAKSFSEVRGSLTAGFDQFLEQVVKPGLLSVEAGLAQIQGRMATESRSGDLAAVATFQAHLEQIEARIEGIKTQMMAEMTKTMPE